MKETLHRLWEGWKRFGRKVGDFQARLLLTVFYFVILAPFALAMRYLADPMGLKRPGGWLPIHHATTGTALDRAKRQF